VQDRLYVSTPGYGEVIVQRVPLTRVAPLEMIQCLTLKTPHRLIVPLRFEAVVCYGMTLRLSSRRSEMPLQVT